MVSLLEGFVKTGSLAQWVECSPIGPEDLGSIPDRVMPKTLKMVLDPIYPTPPLGQDMTQGQFF